MRGTEELVTVALANYRITPAHAGNSEEHCPCSRGVWDHPRACGEQGRGEAYKFSNGGSPPRMRGTGVLLALGSSFLRITPAHAGNSQKPLRHRLPRQDHPRACGEQIPSGHDGITTLGSPPRMRGTGGTFYGEPKKGRITPAHAGNSTVDRHA